MTENEVEDKLTSFITVFKYIDDKDVFQKVNNCPLRNYVYVYPWHTQKKLGGGVLKFKEIWIFLCFNVVLCQNVGKTAYTWLVYVHGLWRSYD